MNIGKVYSSETSYIIKVKAPGILEADVTSDHDPSDLRETGLLSC